MGTNKEKKTICRVYASYQKELRWLEEMAGKGWFLSDVCLGCIYRFARGAPKRMVYDIDRFGLTKKPSLEEIRRKEMFMEMAQEMGWREITHDESQNYYFCKEYEEGGVNRLHNDEESRRYRAEKYRTSAEKRARIGVRCLLAVTALDLLMKLLERWMLKGNMEWYHWFTLIYVILCSLQSIALWRSGARCFRELCLTREEWEESVSPRFHKTVWKLLLTNRGLNRFLGRQAAQGWTLTGVTPLRYSFEKTQGGAQIYALDSKWLVNQRRKASGKGKIGDSKDFCGMNNDWEIQSVRDAEAKGWSFVCALENRSIIYKGEAGKTKPLNDPKYDNRLRWISLIGEYAFYLLLSGLLGGVIGFFMELFFDI